MVKSAWSLANAGWDVLVLGATTNPIGDRFMAGHAPVVVVSYEGRTNSPALSARIRRKLEYFNYRIRERLGLKTPSLLFNVAPMVAAMTPVALAYEPDVIHVHDYTATPLSNKMLEAFATAGLSAPAVIYDAHEYLPGLAHLKPRAAAEYAAHERLCVNGAASVISVSGGMSELLVEHFGLAELPPVVGNDAVTTSRGVPGRTVRDDCGVSDDAFLMVYAGAVAPQRGLGTVIDALPQLPTAHVAILAPEGNRFIGPLKQQARDLGVGERVHILGYVPNNVLINYLAPANAGLIPLLHRPNHEISLITKFGEYMHAGLPILCSDVKTMAAEVHRIGNGEVFAAGDVQDFVRAASAVATNPEKYREAITADAVAERTWERQADVLVKVYAKVAATRSLVAIPRDAVPFGITESDWIPDPRTSRTQTPQR